MNRKIIWALILSSLLGSTQHVRAYGGNSQYEYSTCHTKPDGGAFTLEFRLIYSQNCSTLNKELKDNNKEFKKLDEFINTLLSDSSLSVERIIITGYASIEGAYAVNKRISRNRAEKFKKLLATQYELLDSLPVEVAWVPEDWGTLYSLVASSDLDEKEKVLRLINEVDVFAGREARVAEINRGNVYRKMLADYFPMLRRVEVRVEYRRCLVRVKLEKLTDPVRFSLAVIGQNAVYPGIQSIDCLYQQERNDMRINGFYTAGHTGKRLPRYLNPPKFGLKTNLISLLGLVRGAYFTTPLLNLSTEYFIAPRISIEAGMSYSNWKYNSGKEFQGISGYRFESRFWYPDFGSSFVGYTGVYLQAGDYNIRGLVNASGYGTKNNTGDYYEAGLSTGCYISLSNHWGIDMGARGGYNHSKGKEYLYTSNGNKLLYHADCNRIRFSAVVLALTYRW